MHLKRNDLRWPGYSYAILRPGNIRSWVRRRKSIDAIYSRVAVASLYGQACLRTVSLYELWSTTDIYCSCFTERRSLINLFDNKTGACGSCSSLIPVGLYLIIILLPLPRKIVFCFRPNGAVCQHCSFEPCCDAIRICATQVDLIYRHVAAWRSSYRIR